MWSEKNLNYLIYKLYQNKNYFIQMYHVCFQHKII